MGVPAALSWGWGRGAFGGSPSSSVLSCPLHRGPAVHLAPPSQAGPCVIPHCGRCMRQPQAGTSGPWPLQQDIRMESMSPGMQVLCLGPGTWSGPARAPQGTSAALADVGTPACCPPSFSSPGFPVMCCEDVFVSDPLLPCGQRIPLYLSEASQQVSALPALASPIFHAGLGWRHSPLLSPQVMGSLKLLLPPPIMSPWVLRTPSPGCPTAWLSGPELIALTGLLQMSQGPPRPVALEAPTPPAGPPDPVSDHPDPSGGPSCSHCTDPSAPQTPDTH